MSGAFQLGPLLLPHALLLVFGSLATTLFVGRRLGREAAADVESVLWRSLLVGAVVARLGFVFEFRTAYFASPLDILDIRDGGWNPIVGIIAGWLLALSRQQRQPRLGRPLRWSLLAGTLVYAAGTAALSLSADAGRTLPALSLSTLEGQTVPLDRFMGRPTVVNLWATWCPPCVREMPVLQKAQAERPDVHFVFVNQGESAEKVRSWLSARGITLDHVLIDGKGQASAAFDQKGFPTTLFFDARGRLTSTRIGELSTATLHERLSVIAPQAAAPR